MTTTRFNSISVIAGMIRNVLIVCRLESKKIRSSIRFLVISLGLAVCSAGGYLVSCLTEFYVARDVPSAVGSIPLFLLGNIDPTFFFIFFLVGLVLVFDVDHRDNRIRIAEALHSKPTRNFEFLAGRILATSGLLWLLATSLLLVMQVFGLLAQITGLGFGGAFELRSLFNLLILDIPTALFLWCSFAVMLSIVIQNRVLIVAISILVLIGWYNGVANTPYSLITLASPSSNDTLFVSDIVPEFPSFACVAIRIGAIALAMSIIGLAARCSRRQDQPSTKQMHFVIWACVIGSITIATATAQVLFRNSEIETWKQAHERYDWKDDIDIQEMAGSLFINPTTRLQLDLSIEFSLINDDPVSVFTLIFNPSLSISSLELNGSPSEFDFSNGILEIRSSYPLDTSLIHTLHVVARGRPNPRFAYLDAPLDYLADPTIPIQVTHSFGKDGCIYDKNYVALMPGVHWYPNTQRFGSALGERPERDYFKTNIAVELSESNWQLVGPGVSKNESDGMNRYSINVDEPIPELGLFASEFESKSIQVYDKSLAAYAHAKHAEKLNLPNDVLQELKSDLESSLNQLATHGLQLAQTSLSVVEVPSRLRTVGGGWRMDELNSLPGVILVKERGYPVSNFVVDFEDSVPSIDRYQNLKIFVDLGLGTDNFLRTAPKHFWTHVTSARGEYAEVLDLVVLNLLWNMPYVDWRIAFSPYATIHLVPLTMLSASVVGDYGQSEGLSWLGRMVLPLLEREFASRDAVWNHLENTSISKLPSGLGHQADLELVLLKSMKIAESIVEYHSHDHTKILNWLATVRERFAGRTYEYADLIAAAEEHNIDVHPFLTEWLTDSALPGFVLGPVKATRISDDIDGSLRQQITLDIQNTEPASGIVIPRLESLGSLAPVRIGPNSAKRINIVVIDPPLEESVFSFRVFGGLSLNREPIEISIDLTSHTERLSIPPAEYVEISDWKNEQHGIIIDDMDPGFSILQPALEVSRSLTSGPMGWFRSLNPKIEHLVGVQDAETLYQPTRGWWVRIEDENAYGIHRRTTFVSYAGGRTSLHAARFTANIPKSDSWNLDYHIPRSYLGPVYNTKLNISNGTRSWDVVIDPGANSSGWIPVGTFNLNEGNATVNVKGSTFRSVLYADAIRWSEAKSE